MHLLRDADPREALGERGAREQRRGLVRGASRRPAAPKVPGLRLAHLPGGVLEPLEHRGERSGVAPLAAAEGDEGARGRVAHGRVLVLYDEHTFEQIEKQEIKSIRN